MQLKDYLYGLIAHEDVAQGYYVPRKSKFMGRFMHCFYPDYQLRFFIKEGTVWPAIIHADPIIQGRIDKLPAKNGNLAFVHLADDTIVSLYGKNQSIYRERDRKEKRPKLRNRCFILIVPLFDFSEPTFRRVVSAME